MFSNVSTLVSELKPALLEKFPEQIVGRIDGSGIHGKILIDGSFLTEKLNPEDVDVLLAVDARNYLVRSAAQRL